MKPGVATAVAAVLSGAFCLGGCHQTAPHSAGALEVTCLKSTPLPAHSPDRSGMVLVKGGAFQMGARPMRPEEGPPRPTRVGAFWIDRTDVTNRDFARFVVATGYVTLAERPLDPRTYPMLHGDQLRPSAIVFVGADHPAGGDPSAWWRVVRGADWRHPKGPGSSIAGEDDLPVVQVAWQDAMAYAGWLGRDLPTEAEWEYAARGGRGPTRFVWGDEPLNPDKPQANVWEGVFPAVDTGADGYKARPSPVGCFPANGYGLYDMAGNVWQWTRDWYRPNLNPVDVRDPRGPAATASIDPGDPAARKHVIKGVSFLCAEDACYRYRPAARQPGPTDTGENHIGFRTVLRARA